jgi:hypothetical protein
MRRQEFDVRHPALRGVHPAKSKTPSVRNPKCAAPLATLCETRMGTSPDPRSIRAVAMGQFAVTSEVCRLERGSEVKCPLPGDLNRLFYRVNMHLKSSSSVGFGYPRFDFARMLRGEIQEQDRPIDHCFCPRMQASRLRRPVLNGGACAPRPRRGSAGAPGPGPEIDDVNGLAYCRTSCCEVAGDRQHCRVSGFTGSLDHRAAL